MVAVLRKPKGEREERTVRNYIRRKKTRAVAGALGLGAGMRARFHERSGRDYRGGLSEEEERGRKGRIYEMDARRSLI